VHPEIALIDGEWFNLQSTKELFQIETSEAPFVRIADLSAKLFGNFLLHTPIWQLIVGRVVHFSAGTESVQHLIGRTLAPVEPWGWWGEEIEHSKTRGGLAHLAMEANSDDPPFQRVVSTTIQPSAKVRPGIGIHMEVHDRYMLPTADKTIGCQETIEKLSTTFDASLKRSEAIIDQIMSLKERLS
jgi:hypothetical protein